MKKRVFSMFLALIMVLGMLPATAFAAEGDVAQIGEATYATLEAAIAEVKDGETITLLADCAESVTIKQKAGLSFTIDGAGKNYTGTITVDGNKRSTGTETLTIKNVNFVLSGEWQSGIATKKNTYAHNLTVDGCSFTGKDAGYKASYGVSLRHAYNVVVKNTTGTGLFDLVYGNAAVTGFTAENVTVTDSVYGITLAYVSSTAKFDNVTTDVEEAGLLFFNNAKGTIDVTNSDLKAGTPIVLATKGTSALTANIDAATKLTATEGNVLVQTDANYYTVNIPENADMEKDENGNVVVPPTVAKNEQTGVTYLTFQAAIDEVKNGETITLLADCGESVTVKQKAGLSFTIDGAGKTYTGTITVNGTGKASDQGQGLTIQNVNFDIQNYYAMYGHASKSKDRYVRNVTVQNCTFTASAENRTAFWLRYAYDVTVKDCTAENLDTFFSSTGPFTGLTVENVEIKNSNNGFTLKYPHNATFKNVTIDVANTGVYLQNNADPGEYTSFENCTVTAAKPLVLEEVATKEFNLKTKGTNFVSTDAAWAPTAAAPGTFAFNVESDKYTSASIGEKMWTVTVKAGNVHIYIFKSNDLSKPVAHGTYDAMVGDVISLSDIDINNYYSNANGFVWDGWYNDGGFNSYAPGKPGMETMTVTGAWQNLKAVVTDYEMVVVHAVTNGDKDNAETIYTGKALEGSNLLEYLTENVTVSEKTGYTLDQWYNWDWYGHKFDDSKTVTGWTNVYVTYTANEYEVTFNADGGVVDPASKTVTYDKAYGELPVPTKTGYKFLGWTLNGEAVTAETVVKTAEDHELVAQWEQITFTVTLDPTANGKVNPATVTVTYNMAIGELPVPTWAQSTTKATFLGWFDAEGNEVTAETVYTVLGDSTFTAKWLVHPGSSSTNVTKELFTIQCTEVHEHSWLCNWFGSHVTLVKDSVKWNEELGRWEAQAKIGSGMLSNINSTQTKKNYFGGIYHYYDESNYVFDLYYDPNFTGLNSQNKEVTGMWLPVKEYVVDVYCYTEPAAPSDATVQKLGNKLIWMRDAANTKNNLRSTKLYADTYTVGEMYSKDGKFYVDLTITDLTPYMADFTKKFGEGYAIGSWTKNNTAEDFKFTLVYSGKVTDVYGYKQDGTGWAVDHINTTEKNNGRSLWLVKSYTVTYTDGGVGVFAVETHTVEAATETAKDKFSATATPAFAGSTERKGYNFKGWTPEVAKTVTADAVYTGVWEAIEYTITVNATEGGTVEVQSTATMGEIVKLNITPDKGWKVVKAELKYVVDTSYTTQLLKADGSTAKVFKMPSADVTVVVEFEKILYNITFEECVGGKVVATVDGKEVTSAYYGDEVVFVVTPDEGWALKSMHYNYTGVVNGGGNAATALKIDMPAGDVHLRPVFEKVIYNIVIAPVEHGTVVAKVNGVEANTATFGDVIELVVTPAEGYKVSKLNYYFTLANGGAGGKLNPGDTLTMRAGDVRISAVFEACQYTVTFDANNGAVEPATKVVTFDAAYGELPTPTRRGYDFDGWFLGNTKIEAGTQVKTAADHTLVAAWTANTYTLTCKSEPTNFEQSKNVIYDQPVGTLPTPERTGYTFNGWFDAEGKQWTATSIVDFIDTKVLFADWTANKYTVTLDANGGEVAPTEITVIYDSAYSELPEPAKREGYTFIGWTLNGAEVNAATIVKTAENHTLVAQWEINKHDVTFDVTGKWFAEDETVNKVVKDVVYATSVQPIDAEKANYEFSGWTTKDAYTVGGVTVAAGTKLPVTMPDQDITVVGSYRRYITDGKLTLDDYDVIYTGVAQKPVVTLVVDGVTLVEGTDFTVEYKNNVGNEADAKGVATVIVTGIGDYIGELTTSFEFLYTVTFVSEGITTPDAQYVKYGDVAVNPGASVMHGCNFAGWYINGKTAYDFRTPVTAPITLKAKFLAASIGGVVVPPANNASVTVNGLNTVDHMAYIIGSGDGKVNPLGTITRAEVATIFFRLMNDDFRAKYWDNESSYADVAADAWYNVAVATLENAGIIKDTVTGGNFRPTDLITRAELAVMAAQFAVVNGEVPATTFVDVPATYWAAAEIAVVQYAGWIEGNNGMYRPDANLTRAECMTIVNRMLQRGAEAENMLADMTTFTDNAAGTWYYEAVQEATNSHTYNRTEAVLTGESFLGEKWVKMEAAPDWAALEKAWAEA